MFHFSLVVKNGTSSVDNLKMERDKKNGQKLSDLLKTKHSRTIVKYSAILFDGRRE